MKIEKKNFLSWSGALSAALAALVAGVACSEESGAPSLEGASGGASGAASGGATSMAGSFVGSGASTSTAGTGSITLPSGTAGSASGGGFEKCATSTSKADPRPVNMFIQFDRSGSMMYDTRGELLPIDKWSQAVDALNAFFTDAKSDGLKVALRFFPDDKPVPGCTGDTGGACDATACAQPLVPLGLLAAAAGDPQETALLAAIAGATPASPMTDAGRTGTPMYPALQGALTWAATTQMSLPNERVVVVLVTDGSPQGCQMRIAEIAALASDAYEQYGIMTYAIGIQGSQEQAMHQIAEAGGTERAYFSGDAATAQQDLLAALNAIRGNVLACSFSLPTGENIDPNKVNIQFTGPDGTVQTLARTDAANCSGGGWYYDDPAAPKSLQLCESTCMLVQGAGQAKIDLVLGCATKVR
jgi:hypothetical protein